MYKLKLKGEIRMKAHVQESSDFTFKLQKEKKNCINSLQIPDQKIIV